MMTSTKSFTPYLFETIWFITFSNILIIKDFASDEKKNYHLVNDKINSMKSKSKKIVIHDNFALISMLNSASGGIDIYSANQNDLTFADKKKNILINRFKILNIDNFKELYSFRLIDSLSTVSSPVYSFYKILKINK